MFDKYPDIVNVENLREMLGISRTKAYELVSMNKIKHIRIGNKYLIPKRNVISFVTMTD